MSLKKQAYQQILDRILERQLAPGDILNRRGMARELNMSTAPVHEAMLELEQDGFLEAMPRHGTRVRVGSPEDVAGHLVVREALECQTARMVCGTPLLNRWAELKELATAADSQNLAHRQRAKAEVAFHIGIVEGTECPALVREYRRVMQIGLFYRINLLMNMPTSEPVDRHLRMLEALAEAKPADAEELMRRHVWSGKPDFLKTTAKQA